MTRTEMRILKQELKDAIDRADKWMRVQLYGAKPPANYEGDIPPRPGKVGEELTNAYNSIKVLSDKLLAEIAEVKDHILF